jgi:hypothetical protein
MLGPKLAEMYGVGGTPAIYLEPSNYSPATSHLLFRYFRYLELVRDSSIAIPLMETGDSVIVLPESCRSLGLVLWSTASVREVEDKEEPKHQPRVELMLAGKPHKEEETQLDRDTESPGKCKQRIDGVSERDRGAGER